MSSLIMDGEDFDQLSEDLADTFAAVTNFALDDKLRQQVANTFVNKHSSRTDAFVSSQDVADRSRMKSRVDFIRNAAVGKLPSKVRLPEQKVMPPPVVQRAAPPEARQTETTPPPQRGGNVNINNLPCKPHGEAALTFDDLAGMQYEKNEMTKSIVLPLMFDFIPSRSGILMYGPPGTGKTLIARALLGETNRRLGRQWQARGPNQVTLFAPSAADLKSKYVGEGELKIQELWRCANDYAQAAQQQLGVGRAKSIVFVDEIDSIAPKRQDDSSEATKATVAQLLQILQGAVQLDNVFTIGATNRPWDVDPALERRLGAGKLFVDLPNEQARSSLLDMSFQKYKFNTNDALDYKELLKVLTHLTGPSEAATANMPPNILDSWKRNGREPRGAMKFGAPFASRAISPLSRFGYSGSDITRLVETLAADSAWTFVNQAYQYQVNGQTKDCFFTIEAHTKYAESGGQKYKETFNELKCSADVIKSVKLPLPKTLGEIADAAERAPSSINDADYIRLLEYAWKMKLAPGPQ